MADREEIREAEELELRLKDQLELLRRSAAESGARPKQGSGNQKAEGSVHIEEQGVANIVAPVVEAYMGAVGGVPLDDDTPIPDHLVEIISSTKDGRGGQMQLGIPDDMSHVYNRYRTEWEARMRQLEESVYRAEELEKENAEREKQLEQMVLDKEAEYRQLSSKEAVEKVTEEEKYLTHEMQQLEMQVEARTRSALEKKAQLQMKENQIKEKEKETKNTREKHNQYSVLKKETEALRRKLLENEIQLKQLSGDQDVLDTTESKSFINSKNEQVSENAGLKDSQTKITSISKTQTLKVNPEQINTKLIHTA